MRMRRGLFVLVFAGAMTVPVAAQAAISCHGSGSVLFCHGTERTGSTTINYVDVKESTVQGQVQVAQVDDGAGTTTGVGGCAVGRCQSYVTSQAPLLPPIP
jgi:hypothetical protein